jgi:hypothetical protein
MWYYDGILNTPSAKQYRSLMIGPSHLKWNDKQCLMMLSRIWSPSEADSVNRKEKHLSASTFPCLYMVTDYIKNIGFIDMTDTLKTT